MKDSIDIPEADGNFSELSSNVSNFYPKGHQKLVVFPLKISLPGLMTSHS